MPFSINARGGDYRVHIGTQSKEDALRDLEGLRQHLSAPGNASGVLTLFNRSRGNENMTLERKNRFQLMFGYGKRLQDTKTALTTMLHRAGLPEAVKDLEQYLSRKPEGERNRVSARQMLRVLDKHLAPVKGNEAGGGSGGLGADGSGVEPSNIVDDEPGGGLFERERLHSLDLSQPFEQKSLRPQAPRAEMVQGGSLTECLTNAGVTIGKPLGRGAFGLVSEVTVRGQEAPFVLKRFHNNEKDAQGNLKVVGTPLKNTRDGVISEAIAAYLTSKTRPDYASEVNVKQPSFFLVANRLGEYRMVTPLELRTLLKQDQPNTWFCAGLLMPKADGAEAAELNHQRGALSLEDKKQIIKGTLQSVMKLNERGFIHRDLKLENVLFDKTSGKTTVIDTGMMYKTSKNRPDRFASQSVGTPGFMDPSRLVGQRYGSEADLYATGIMALELAHGDEGYRLAMAMEKQCKDTYKRSGTLQTPTQLFQLAIRGLPEQQQREVLGALRDPKSLTSLAVACLEKASNPRTSWDDRKASQGFYAELLWHPSLN